MLATRFNRADVAQTVTRNIFQSPWALLWYDLRGDRAGAVQSPGSVAQRTDASFYSDPSLLQWGTTGRTTYSEHVNVLRDSWNNPSSTVMFKGGYKGVAEHDSFDGGSFIFDALGTRWATDLYHDSYSLAPVGGTNYGLYRKRAEGQNTLVINPGSNDYLSSTDVTAVSWCRTKLLPVRTPACTGSCTSAFRTRTAAILPSAPTVRRRRSQLVENVFIDAFFPERTPASA